MLYVCMITTYGFIEFHSSFKSTRDRRTHSAQPEESIVYSKIINHSLYAVVFVSTIIRIKLNFLLYAQRFHHNVYFLKTLDAANAAAALQQSKFRRYPEQATFLFAFYYHPVVVVVVVVPASWLACACVCVCRPSIKVY